MEAITNEAYELVLLPLDITKDLETFALVLLPLLENNHTMTLVAEHIRAASERTPQLQPVYKALRLIEACIHNRRTTANH